MCDVHFKHILHFSFFRELNCSTHSSPTSYFPLHSSQSTVSKKGLWDVGDSLLLELGTLELGTLSRKSGTRNAAGCKKLEEYDLRSIYGLHPEQSRFQSNKTTKPFSKKNKTKHVCC
jgi:hypothetical protein